MWMTACERYRIGHIVARRRYRIGRMRPRRLSGETRGSEGEG